jgi:hypothetical protein
MAFETWLHYLGPAIVVEYTTRRLLYMDHYSCRFQGTEAFKAYMLPVEQARLLEVPVCKMLP